jgi:hypothetical protein
MPLLALVLLFPILLETQTNNEIHPFNPFTSLISYILANKVATYFSSVFIVSINAFAIHRLTDKQGVFIKSNHVVSVIYIILVAISPKITNLLSLHLASFFILLTLYRIGNLYLIEKPYYLLFECGILISMATFFYLPCSLLLIWIFISAIILKPFVWRDFVIPIIGFLLPFWFYAFYLLYFDISIESILHFKTIFSRNIIPSVSDIFSFSFIIVLIGAAFISYFFHIQKKSVRIRKIFLSYLWLFIILLFSILIPNSSIRTTAGLFAIPFGILITDFLLLIENRKWLPEIILYFLILIYLFNHIYINNLFPFN